jgi:type IV secretory pathway VirB6-like protein
MKRIESALNRLGDLAVRFTIGFLFIPVVCAGFLAFLMLMLWVLS